MTMHVPALHAAPIAHEAEVAAEAAERRCEFIDTLATVVVAVVVITLISALGVALELG